MATCFEPTAGYLHASILPKINHSRTFNLYVDRLTSNSLLKTQYTLHIQIIKMW